MTIQPDARGKVYRRVTNGLVVDYITVREALDIANDAMMAGRSQVRRMASGQGRHAILFKNGVAVDLVEIDAADMPADTPAEEPEEHWSTVSHATILHRTLLHLFTAPDKSGRAVCNKSYRPWLYGNGYSFKTRSEHEESKYADMYTFCPRCERKQKQR